MESEITSKEVDRLAELLRSDSLQEADAEKLRKIIRSHPAARRRLAEHLYLSAELRDQLQGNPSEVVPARIAWFRQPAVRRALLPIAAAVALVLGYAWKANMPSDVPPTAGPPESGELDADGIAVISRTKGAVWGASTSLEVTRLESGLPVGPGMIELTEGLVQIDFYSGATVILEAPAKLELANPMLSRLDYGNLWAQVPVPARGFRVETRQYDVVDLGTEFGIRVGAEGEGEVHVLDGEVEVFPDADGGETEKLELLTRGQGVRWSAGGVREAIDARPEAFHASKGIARAARENLHRWEAYSETLRQDPDLLVDYSFMSDSPWERQVENRAATALPGSYGAVVGCEWTQGRWPGKGGLRFSNSSHRVRLNLPGEYDALTMACWVRLDDLDSQEVALLHPETNQRRFVHWTLVKVAEDKVHVHFSETLNEGVGEPVRHHYHADFNLFSKPGGELGDWMQLVVVYDPEAELVRHYLNGVPIDARPIIEKRKLGVGVADIGNWPYHEWAAGTEFEVRNLDGVVDEFLILKRAWTPEEVTRHWESGKP
ncbi:hypothetical protein HAHE_01160 [Haloferula helveola]|uniref:FecR protein domain-containing protein n=1 Tax=Haloferula helveola TaxID=490095 RepID=A0ABM7RGJ9_9BACT|nr:hypothetical protein HAHE_01160 [Haloferula helveola]